MSAIYYICGLTFVIGLCGVCLHRTYLLSVLLCFEGMMLSLFIALAMWAVETGTSACAPVPLILLVFSTCEAATGLALLVAISRTHGTSQLQSLSLLRC